MFNEAVGLIGTGQWDIWQIVAPCEADGHMTSF